MRLLCTALAVALCLAQTPLHAAAEGPKYEVCFHSDDTCDKGVTYADIQVMNKLWLDSQSEDTCGNVASSGTACPKTDKSGTSWGVDQDWPVRAFEILSATSTSDRHLSGDLAICQSTGPFTEAEAREILKVHLNPPIAQHCYDMHEQWSSSRTPVSDTSKLTDYYKLTYSASSSPTKEQMPTWNNTATAFAECMIEDISQNLIDMFLDEFMPIPTKTTGVGTSKVTSANFQLTCDQMTDSEGNNCYELDLSQGEDVGCTEVDNKYKEFLAYLDPVNKKINETVHWTDFSFKVVNTTSQKVIATSAAYDNQHQIAFELAKSYGGFDRLLEYRQLTKANLESAVSDTAAKTTEIKLKTSKSKCNGINSQKLGTYVSIDPTCVSDKKPFTESTEFIIIMVFSGLAVVGAAGYAIKKCTVTITDGGTTGFTDHNLL